MKVCLSQNIKVKEKTAKITFFIKDVHCPCTQRKCIAADMHTFSFYYFYRQCKVRTLLISRGSDTLLQTIFYTKVLFRSKLQDYCSRKPGYVLKLPPTNMINMFMLTRKLKLTLHTSIISI